MSIFRFVRQVLEGETLTVYGDGSQERDFTYVDDIARGTVACLGVRGHEVVNLGGSQTTSLLEVIRMISQFAGREAHIENLPLHPADMPRTWADNTRALRLLGWAPEVSLQEGLRRTIAWYLENRQRALAIQLGD
jgi:nucleoside-diphosphate-sugar epimerase